MSLETAADKIGAITGSAWFRRAVVTLILLNAIIVCLDTYPQIHAGKILLIDRVILYCFHWTWSFASLAPDHVESQEGSKSHSQHLGHTS